jgi:NAD(P)-dependent dehydrogenase (short-subunit alcohol dehydrogenase family)
MRKVDAVSLQGKVALVTGGARGIGRAIALALGHSQADVAVGDVHLEKFAGERYYRVRQRHSGDDEDPATVDAVRAHGVRSIGLEFDVSDHHQVRRAINEVSEVLGPVDVLVNNAGIVNNIAPIADMSPDAWQHELSVNLTGAFNCIQAVVPGMADRGWGRIITIASVAAERPDIHQVAYAASKAGVIALTRTVAKAYGKFGVTANAVMPGLIGTPLVLSMPREVRDRFVASVPAARLGEPSEVAALVAFLATPAAGFVNGAAIPCDGGWLLGPSDG